MRLLERYILRQLVLVAVVVTLTLTIAIWLTQSLRFVELIVNRGLSLQSYLELTLLLLPSFLSLMLPVALFTSVLFTYNKLITESELVVLRAAGLGPFQLARPALLLATVIVASGYFLTLYLLPWSYRQFKDFEFNIRSDYSAVLLKEGAFNNVSSGITVYVRSREVDGELQGILIHDNRVREKTFTLMAERGRLVITEEGPRVVLVSGNRQQFDAATGKLSLLYFDRYSVDLGKVGQSQEYRWREPRERFISELINPGSGPDDLANLNRFRSELHSRLVSPSLGFAFTLVSLAALLSGDFNRRGQSRRVLFAIAIVAALQAGAVALGNAITRWPNLAPVPYVCLAIVVGSCLWWLARGDQFSRRGRARA
jgi:lipopolysaccharide export system permease protein